MYYVDLELVDNAKDLIESTIKICLTFFEEDDKNVIFFKINLQLVTKRMANFIPPFIEDLQS